MKEKCICLFTANIRIANIFIVIFLLVLPLRTFKADEKSNSERISFISFRPGNWDIYYFENGNKNPRRLTTHPGLDYNPVFSPNGRYVIFCSERRGNPDLYVLDLQSKSAPRLLIDSEAMEDQPAISPDGRSIVFVSTKDGNAELYKMSFKHDRTQTMRVAENLTRNTGGDFRPSFSPGGKKIVFSTDRDTPPTGDPADRRREGEIYEMDLDGNNVRRLTHSPNWDGSPVWSSDVTSLYFYALRDKTYRIWSMDYMNRSARAVSPAGKYAISPAVLPDGRIAYATAYGSGENVRWKIVSINRDGSDERDESDTTNNYWGPTVNPRNGAILCYGSGPENNDAPVGSTYPGQVYLGPGPLLATDFPKIVSIPDRQLEVYPIRGFSAVPHPTQNLLVRTELPGPKLIISDMRGYNSKVINTINKDQLPWIGMSWSPDGNWLTYMVGEMFSHPKSEADIWKVRPDGSDAVNLTQNSPGNDGFPSISGDGKKIVFRSGRTGNFDIFIMNADGTDIRNLTNHPANDTFPAFSPKNDEIAFSSNRDGTLDLKTGNRIFEIYTMKIKADGNPGVIKRITYSSGQNAHPQYSPDGRWLVFTSERGGINDEEPLLQLVMFCPQIFGEINVCRLVDGKIFRLTHNKWEDGFPSWGQPVR